MAADRRPVRPKIRRIPRRFPSRFYPQSLFVNRFLESLAGLEGGGLGSRDGDGLVGAGVAALTGAAAAHFKRAKAHNLHLFALDQFFRYGIQYGIDRLLGIFLRKAGFFLYHIDQFGFVHNP